MSRPRRLRGLAVTGALLAVVLAGAFATPAMTDAAWTDTEVSTSSALTAGTVTPVTAMTCTAGALAPVTFTWTAPVNGLPRTGYRYTVTGGLTTSGTLAAGATSMQFTTALLGIGSGTFSLYAVGPGGWESVVKTGTLSFLTAILSSCSVP
ncbi:hypothetical protein [Microbacterium sulfonylureivorans]|uniref:hypothetical protein n=1 Tax=Microbacterium sulfonylureivorans TaxID=2486854 RepID=UPI000FDC2776|nr:hypothetical protein [Microbacterium sulfonylureivorans]